MPDDPSADLRSSEAITDWRGFGLPRTAPLPNRGGPLQVLHLRGLGWRWQLEGLQVAAEGSPARVRYRFCCVLLSRHSRLLLSHIRAPPAFAAESALAWGRFIALLGWSCLERTYKLRQKAHLRE